MTAALVLIDLQNDYFPGGRMELVGADADVQLAFLAALNAAGAAADKTREKPDITPKLDMMSMRNDAPRTGRTIQVAKKKPLTYGETLIIINVQTSRTIKNKKQNR